MRKTNTDIDSLSVLNLKNNTTNLLKYVFFYLENVLKKVRLIFFIYRSFECAKIYLPTAFLSISQIFRIDLFYETFNDVVNRLCADCTQFNVAATNLCWTLIEPPTELNRAGFSSTITKIGVQTNIRKVPVFKYFIQT